MTPIEDRGETRKGSKWLGEHAACASASISMHTA
jgi:hypothetical protein